MRILMSGRGRIMCARAWGNVVAGIVFFLWPLLAHAQVDLFATYFGGTGSEQSPLIAVHPSTGDIYIAGYTNSGTGLPAVAGGAQTTTGNMFVARLSADLRTVRQATLLGTGSSEFPYALGIHPTSGEVYVAGVTSQSLPGTTNGAQPATSSSQPGFVVRLNEDLTQILQATYVSGSQTEQLAALAFLPSGDVVVAGTTYSTDLPNTAGGAQPAVTDTNNGFVVRLSADLRTWIQSTYIGGSTADTLYAVSVDPLSSDVLVAGFTYSTDLPGTATGAITTIGGNGGSFVSRFSGDLRTLRRSTFYAAPTGYSQVSAMALDPSGDVFITGYTNVAGLPGTAGGAQPGYGGGGDTFIARFSGDLALLRGATYLGGELYEQAQAIAVDVASGDVYVAGTTQSGTVQTVYGCGNSATYCGTYSCGFLNTCAKYCCSIPVGSNATIFPGMTGAVRPAFSGQVDQFVARLKGDLTQLRQSTYLGGSSSDQGGGVAIHPNGSIYVAGMTYSADYPVGGDAAQAVYSGVWDATVARLTHLLGAPAGFSAYSGSSQSAAINSQFASPLRVQLTEANGDPIPFVSVAFTAPSSGASAVFAAGVTVAVPTDSQGIATAPMLMANATLGSFTVTATAPATSTSVSFSLTNVAGAPATIVVGPGYPTSQSARVGGPFLEPLGVQVTDSSGNPVSGVIVTFSGPPTGASASFSVPAPTESMGIAQVIATAKQIAGAYDVTATVSGVAVPAVFNLSNFAGPMATLSVVSGSPQSAAIGAAFAQAITARLTDAYGNAIASQTIAFTVPRQGASAVLTGGSVDFPSNYVDTDANGTASVTATANGITGAYSIQVRPAVIGQPPTAQATLTNTAGTASVITAVGGNNQSARVNAIFSNALQARATDAGGNAVAGVTVMFTLPTSGVGGTFTSATTTAVVTDAYGVATSPPLQANGSTGTWTATAALGAMSAIFTETNTVSDVGYFATHFGTAGMDSTNAFTIDPVSGDVYVCGLTQDTALPAIAGGAQTTFAGAFVARFSADLLTLKQSTYLGATAADTCSSIVINPTTRDVYVMGTTASSALTGTAGAGQTTYAGGAVDGFIALLSNDLRTMRQATYFGGAGSYDYPQQIVLDPASGDVLMTGWTDSGNLPQTSGAPQPSHAGGGYDAFVTRISGDLRTIRQTTYFGGSGADYGYGIAIQPGTGDVYVTGEAASTNLPGTGNGGAYPSMAGVRDGYVVRFSPDLRTLRTATYIGGSDLDWGWRVALHANGDVYVAGTTKSSNFPQTAGAAQPDISGAYVTGFVAQLSADLATLRRATYLGGSQAGLYQQPGEMAVNPSNGNLYIAGRTDSSQFPSTAGSLQPVYGGAIDGFVATLTSDLSALVQATYLGGAAYDATWGIAIHPISGDLYVAGETDSTDFPATTNTYQRYSGGARDGILARLPTTFGPAPSVPDAPTNVVATADDRRATVTFTAPANNGGSPITSYAATASPGGSTASCTTPCSSITVLGLTNGVTYILVVAATNAVGTGPASAPSNTVIASGDADADGVPDVRDNCPFVPNANQADADADGIGDACDPTPNGDTVPGAPTGVTATAGNAQASVAFNAPVSDGGRTITSYTATSSPGNVSVACAAPCGSITVNGLTNGQPYTFTVTATNALGTGPASTPSNAVVPSAPQSATTTTLASGLNPSAAGQSVTFTATVAGSAPTGTITFSEGGTTLCNSTLASGQATCTQTLSFGSHSVTAAYAGDANNLPSTSSTVTQLVTAGAPTTVQLVSGGLQTAIAGSPFDLPLVVKVLDTFGNAVPNVQVSFIPPSRGASATLAGDPATTDGAGVAQVIATANATAGVYDILVSAGPTFSSIPLLNVFASPQTVAAGYLHTCALTASGGVKCWGDNIEGQLGNGTATGNSLLPVDVPSLTGIAGIGTSTSHTCALNGAGDVKCWGRNSYGQIGNGSQGGFQTSPALVPLLAGLALDIAVGENHTCALLAGGVECWGFSDEGQLGIASPGGNVPTPVDVAGLATQGGVSAGGAHSCAVDLNGTARCWGRDLFGELGDSQQTAYVATPVDVVGLATRVFGVVTGRNHSCAITNSGGVECWGDNQYGQLGDRTFTTRIVPSYVPDLRSQAVALAAGANHTCALMADAAVMCWGDNAYGQLTGFPSAAQAMPLSVPGLPPGVVAITAGHRHSCARLQSGAVMCWGDNSSGQLGDGTATQTSVPVFARGFPGAPTSIAATNGAGQSAAVATPFALPLEATVRDSNGNTVQGAVVTFTVPASGASGGILGRPVTTDASGVARTNVSANTITGNWNVTAVVAGAAGSATFAMTNTPGPPATIVAIPPSTPQTALTGTLFPAMLDASVTDSYGNAVSGATVTFTTPTSGASGRFSGNVTTTTATTNASGIASVSITANGTAGTFTVTARVTGVATAATFTLTSVLRTGAAIVATAGNAQSAAVGTPFGQVLTATVTDASSNPISNITVTFTLPTGTVSGTFPGNVRTATALTNASGIAMSRVITATTRTGSFIARGTVTGIATSANYNLTNNPGAPSTLTARVGAQSTAVYSAFARALATRVTDSYGNIVPGVSIAFTVPASGPTATFQGTVPVTTDATGIATTPLLVANNIVGAYTATATYGALTPATFALTNTVGAGATATASNGTPQSTTVAQAFPLPLDVVVKDASNRPIQGVNVTFTLPGTAASATFPGSVRTAIVPTAANSHAIAPQPMTATTRSGTFTATARAAGITGTLSFSLTNLASAPTAVAANGLGSQSTAVNTNFALAPSVRVTDAYGNRVPGVAVTFALPPIPAPPAFVPSGTFVAGTGSLVTDATGVATTSLIKADSAIGTWNGTATAAGVATPVLFRMTNVIGSGATIVPYSGTPQTTARGTAFAQPLAAIVKDGNGNGVAGVTVTFTLPTGAASARFMPANARTMTAITDATAVASTGSTVIQATATAGTYAATATAMGTTGPAAFQLTNQ